MYYVVKSIEDAKRIHRKHPYLDLKRLEKIISIALSRTDFKSQPAVFVSTRGDIEYCERSYYEEHPGYGEQGFVQLTIKYNKGTK